MLKKFDILGILSASLNFSIKSFETSLKDLLLAFCGTFFGVALAFVPVFVPKMFEGNIFSVFTFLILGILMFCFGFYKYLILQLAYYISSRDYFLSSSIRENEHYLNLAKDKEKPYIKLLCLLCLVYVLCSLPLILLSVYIGYAVVFMKTVPIFAVVVSLLYLLLISIFFSRLNIVLPYFSANSNGNSLQVLKEAFNFSNKKAMLCFGYTFLFGVLYQVVDTILGLALTPFVMSVGANVSNAITVLKSIVLLFLFLPLTTSYYMGLYLKLSK